MDIQEQRLLDEHKCRKIRDDFYVSKDVYVISESRAKTLVEGKYNTELQPFLNHRYLAHEPHSEWRDNATFVFRKFGTTPKSVNVPVESKSIYRFKLDQFCRPRSKFDTELLTEVMELRTPDFVLTHESEDKYME